MDIAAQIEVSVDRLLAESVSPDVLRACETGTIPQNLSRAMDELGLHAALIPEEAGGFGLTWTELAPSFRLLGAHCCPMPVGEQVIARAALDAAGIDAPDGRFAVSVRPGAMTGKLVPWVLGAGLADTLVVENAGRGRAELATYRLADLPPVDRPAISRTPHSDIDLSAGGPDRAAASGPVSLFEMGALLRALQISGAASRVTRICLDYADERVQFGRKIRQFQAVQHLLADMAADAAAVMAVTDMACMQIGAPHGRLSVAIAKARASAAAGRIAAIAHEIHAAIGVTEAYHLHFLTRRLWQWRDDFGSEYAWQDEIGAAFRQSGAEGLWPGLVTATGGRTAVVVPALEDA